jgi:hypothetical protein
MTVRCKLGEALTLKHSFRCVHSSAASRQPAWPGEPGSARQNSRSSFASFPVRSSMPMARRAPGSLLARIFHEGGRRIMELVMYINELHVLHDVSFGHSLSCSVSEQIWRHILADPP